MQNRKLFKQITVSDFYGIMDRIDFQALHTLELGETIKSAILGKEFEVYNVKINKREQEQRLLLIFTKSNGKPLEGDEIREIRIIRGVVEFDYCTEDYNIETNTWQPSRLIKLFCHVEDSVCPGKDRIKNEP